MERASTAEAIKLLETLGPQPGVVFPWEALEEILAPLTRRDRRFRTIYRAWIRHIRKWQNRKAIVKAGLGIQILREDERAGDVCETLGKTWHILERAKTDIDDIQIAELTETALTEVHHTRVVTHRLHRTMAVERAQLPPGFRKPEPTPPQVRRFAPDPVAE